LLYLLINIDNLLSTLARIGQFPTIRFSAHIHRSLFYQSTRLKSSLIHSSLVIIVLSLSFARLTQTHVFKQTTIHSFLYAQSEIKPLQTYLCHHIENTHNTIRSFRFLLVSSILLESSLETHSTHPYNHEPLRSLQSLHVFQTHCPIVTAIHQNPLHTSFRHFALYFLEAPLWMSLTPFSMHICVFSFSRKVYMLCLVVLRVRII